jgi:predicted nucleic acid-binding protein
MARVILDSSALIALYSNHDKHHDWAMKMFMETIEFQLAMPVLTYAEALIHPLRSGKKKEFQAGIRGLGIEISSIPHESVDQIAELRASTKLRMPDVVVLSEAMNTSSAIATTDQLLAKTASSFSLPVYSPS